MHTPFTQTSVLPQHSFERGSQKARPSSHTYFSPQRPLGLHVMYQGQQDTPTPSDPWQHRAVLTQPPPLALQLSSARAAARLG
jgi:hypothetical protein